MNTLIASLGFAAAAQAAPFNPDTVPAEASFYGHVDVEAFRQGELGRNLIGSLDETQQARLRFFQRLFGFSPVNDVDGVTLFGLPGEPDAGVIMLDGKFDPATLVDLIRAADDFHEHEFRGQTVYQWFDEDDQQLKYGAFYGRDRVLVSDRKALVEAALRVLDQGASSLADESPELASELARDSALLLGVANLDAVEADPDAAFLQQVNEAILIVEQTKDSILAFLALETDTVEQAANVQKVISGLLAFMALNAEENPLGAELASRAECIREGNRIEMTLDMPNSLAEDFLKKRMAENQ